MRALYTPMTFMGLFFKASSLFLVIIGLYLWYELYIRYAEVYRRHDLVLPVLMLGSFSAIVFAESFDSIVHGLSFYVQLFALFVLSFLVWLCFNILQSNGI